MSGGSQNMTNKKAGLSGLFRLAGAIALMSTLIVAANAEPIAIEVVSDVPKIIRPRFWTAAHSKECEETFVVRQML